MYIKQFGYLVQIVVLFLIFDHLPGYGHSIEHIPQDNSHDDVVAQVKYYSFTVILTVTRVGEQFFGFF